MSRRDLSTFLGHCDTKQRNRDLPAAERALWRALAEEIRTYLAEPPAAVDLFGQAATEPTTAPTAEEEP